jgi:hypothetical protein
MLKNEIGVLITEHPEPIDIGMEHPHTSRSAFATDWESVKNAHKCLRWMSTRPTISDWTESRVNI